MIWKFEKFYDKYLISLKLLLLFAISLMIPLKCISQEIKIGKKAGMLVQTAQKFHINPRPVDDTFSRFVFSDFIEQLDPYGLYFQKTDWENLSSKQFHLDEALINEDASFVLQTSQLYRHRLMSADSLLLAFQKRNFDYSQIDSVSFSEKTIYHQQSDWVKYWERIIKLHALTYLLEDSDTTATFENPSLEEMSLHTQKAINNELERVQTKLNYSEGLESYVENCYLKAVAKAFDPHTEYFSEADEETFNHILSKEAFSFGFSLFKNDEGNFEIYEIIPGSPTWDSNLINEGDIIRKVKANGKIKDFKYISLRQVMDFLNNDELLEADFFILKQNGEEINLTLIKDKLDVQSNIIKSYLLDGENKIAYIYIPTFYSQFDGKSYDFKGCANDLAKELIQLKKESVEGLILDFRDNGGGSMLEAIFMAGLFVDYGAVGIFQMRNHEPETLKDMNKGTLFNNPLVILINEYSASASELFAAAMQDLNRAVIVGTKSFGKSTAQTIMPLDSYLTNEPDLKKESPLGYVKLTNGVFYRVTGQNHQKVGVIPHIQLPSLYDGTDWGEAAFPTALEPDSIDKKTYYIASQPLPIEKLFEQSANRINQNPTFQEIVKLSKIQADKQIKYTIPLQIDAFQYFNIEEEKQVEPINEQSNYTVHNPTYQTGLSSMVALDEANNVQTLNQIKQDLYIQEALNIITDLINLIQK